MWPWRGTQKLEQAIALLEGLRAEARAQRVVAEKQAELARELTGLLRSCQEHVFQLKRQGFEVPAPTGAPEPMPELPEPVAHAIEERAEPGTPLYAQLARWAWRALRTESEPDEVAQEILDGGYVL